MRYLWCRECEHTYDEAQWTRNGLFAHGVCPNPYCAARGYKSAVDWYVIATTNGYEPIPENGEHYPLYRLDM
jgi:hypothetical protein